VGGIAGSVLAIRYKPARPLLVGNLFMLLEAAALIALIPPLRRSAWRSPQRSPSGR
jgi:hypothetical protein